jgi:hypothetical protein
MFRVRRCRRAKERIISTLASASSITERSAASSFTTACAWCGDVQTGQTWSRPSQPLVQRNVSHGICPSCYAKVQAERTSLLRGKLI